jgi:hypothetical protein
MRINFSLNSERPSGPAADLNAGTTLYSSSCTAVIVALTLLAAQGFLICFTVDANARAKGSPSPAFGNCEARCAGKYIEGTTGLPPSPSGYRRCANHCRVVYPSNASTGAVNVKKQNLPAHATTGSRNSKQN